MTTNLSRRSLLALGAGLGAGLGASTLMGGSALAFDVVFIDADKPGNPQYLAKALQLSRPGTLIIGDNVVRDGSVADASSTDPNVVGVRSFIELLALEPRVQATAIQTVGVKGYDGFALALVLDG